MKDVFQLLEEIAPETYIKILKINLTTDSFVVIKGDDFIENGLSQEVDGISDYLSAFVERGLVHKDDEVDFRRLASLEYLRSFFREHHHRNIFWITYRRKKGDSYAYSVMEMMPDFDYSDENQSLYLFVKDLSAADESALLIEDNYKALCENFIMIGNLDPETGNVIIYRAPQKVQKESGMYLSDSYSYETMINWVKQNSVTEADRENFSHSAAISFIREQLSRKTAYSFDYRVYEEGEIAWHRFKFARIGNAKDYSQIVLSIADVSNEKRAETDFYRNGKTVLLAEDNELNREMLQAILEDDYNVISTENGEQALAVLKERHEEIAIIITDIQMPVMDGKELLKKVKANHAYRAIPVIVATGMEDSHMQEECLLMGAADYISKPYNPVIIKSRVEFMIRYREASNILHLVEKDALTGLYTKEFFYRNAKVFMDEHPERRFAMIVTDIEGLRGYNERYGVEAGDALIRSIGEEGVNGWAGIRVAGRIDGATFAALIDNLGIEEWNYSTISDHLSKAERKHHFENVTLKSGIYMIEESLPVSIICDRAKLAMNSVKGVFGQNWAIYDDKLSEKLNRQQEMSQTALTALRERQIQVYYQPKHGLSSDKTEGAEALVRWIHPGLGFINPGEFISLFEANGFIKQLDMYVFERVCEDILRWKQTGIPVVPVSINLSRRDFELEDLDKKIISHVKEAGIDTSLIHFEITESAFANDAKKVAQIVDSLHDAGFQIELDDFGTGYSSLTALTSMHLDVVKLDMSIIRNDRPEYEANILEFAMHLAKIVHLKTVQEGVETQEQVDRLRALGCDYIQGYFYSRPLPVKEFEAYLLKEQEKD